MFIIDAWNHVGNCVECASKYNTRKSFIDASIPLNTSSMETAPVFKEIRSCYPAKKWAPRNGRSFVDSEIVDIVKFLEDSECLKDATKFAVDLGANDGHGPSEKLFFPPFSYSGLMVEGDMKWLDSMQKVIPSPDVKKRISWISPSTISHTFSKEGVPKNLVYLKIDMDADDCATLAAIMASGFRPRVLQMEMTPEIPYPLSFGVLPLFKYGYDTHNGFQSCSMTMMHAIAEVYEYRLVSVGGTKDALFVHAKMSTGFHVLDASKAYYDFAACCWADPNPSNTRYLETARGVKLGEIYPTAWLGLSRNPSMKDKLFSSVLAYMLYACEVRGSNLGINEKNCSFAFLLSSSPTEAAKNFIGIVTGTINMSTSPSVFGTYMGPSLTK